MQCKELESVLENEGLGPLPADAQRHLADCTFCQDLLADLSEIALAARQLPAEVQPPDRIWVSLRTQLELEGVIHAPEDSTADLQPATSWWQSLDAFLRPRNLATVGVGLLLLVGAVLQTRKSGPAVPASSHASVAGNTSPAAAPFNVPLPSPSETALTLQQAERDLPNIQLAGNSTVDASLRQNLRTVDEFIGECELHLKQNPRDELAREYLYSAYQQKADLLAAMMDSGRSEH